MGRTQEEGNLLGEKNVFLSGGDQETVGCASAPAALPGVLHRNPWQLNRQPADPLEHDDAGSVGLVVVIGNWNEEAGSWYSRTVWERTRAYHGQAQLVVVVSL